MRGRDTQCEGVGERVSELKIFPVYACDREIGGDICPVYQGEREIGGDTCTVCKGDLINDSQKNRKLIPQ